MRRDPLLDGQVALVTGAGGGIGAAAAHRLAEEGAEVVVADIESSRAQEVAGRIESAGGRARAEVVDVREAAQVQQMAKAVLRDLGRVDVLVNNVGHHLGPKRFLAGEPEHWQALYEVNLLHVFQCTQAFLPSMVERGSGSIVNVSSIEGIRGYPPDAVYGAFKAALVHFTRCLAVDVGAQGVRVNGIAPDVTDSLQVPYAKMVPEEHRHLWPSWVPVGRMGQPADQADVILFLASDQSRFITGHTIPTDGGTGASGGWFPSKHRPGGFTNRPIDP